MKYDIGLIREKLPEGMQLIDQMPRKYGNGIRALVYTDGKLQWAGLFPDSEELRFRDVNLVI